MSISQEVKIIRQKSFLSQTEFARQIDVSFTTVNRWETDKMRPSLTALKKIKDFCDTRDIDYTPLEEAYLRNNQ